eukprot:INCI6210.1.p1 GENE.INCI6210.1~~INCI6210.1.p1  ORF type:complete len:564 (-),score=123.18 INCI6210.1:9-1700(-)
MRTTVLLWFFLLLRAGLSGMASCCFQGGVEKEREAVRPHIIRWAARGVRIKDGVEKLWAGERDLETLTFNMNRNSSLVMHVLLVTTKIHEMEQARIEKEAEGIDLGELAALLMGDTATKTEDGLPDLVDANDVSSSDSEHDGAPAPATGSESGAGASAGANAEAPATAEPAAAAASSGSGSPDDAAAAARLVSEVTNLLLQNTNAADSSAQVIHDDGDTTDSGHDDSFSYTSDASADFSGDYDDEFEMPVLAGGGEYVEVRAETDDESARASAAESTQNASENETGGEDEDEPFRNTLEIAIRMSLQESSAQPESAAAGTGGTSGAVTAAGSSGSTTTAPGAEVGASLSGASAPGLSNRSRSSASSSAVASGGAASSAASTGGAPGTAASAALAANLSRLEQALRPIPFQRTRSHPAPSRSGIISMATAGGSHRSRSSSRRRAEEAAAGGTRSPGSGATSPRSGASSSAGSELSRGYPMRRTRSAGNGSSSLNSARVRPRSRSNRRSRSRDTTSASASASASASSQSQPQPTSNGADANDATDNSSGNTATGSSSSSSSSSAQ